MGLPTRFQANHLHAIAHRLFMAAGTTSSHRRFCRGDSRQRQSRRTRLARRTVPPDVFGPH